MTLLLPQTQRDAHKGGFKSKTTPKFGILYIQMYYVLEAGLPVTKTLGFSNKINNKINLAIIYRYLYIYILQSAISLISEKQNWSAAAGGSEGWE